MGKAEYKVAGGKLVRATVKAENGKIKEIKLTGDFFIHPEDFIEELEKALIGSPLHESNLAKRIKALANEKNATLLGVSPEDFAKCIVMAGEKDE
ncbi:hypothetical protein H5T51_08225 [Candidatus Bathyarchaeota archaeon]|nr:hypothetical protein [Candidatus Bathyarchaeota archaeon]